MKNHDRYAEHPVDVLSALNKWQHDELCALAVITRIEGGAVRNAGALMAVSQSGNVAGYISGGCIDADIVLQAQQALEKGVPRMVQYGAGSPFVDLPLPCGGTINLLIIPHPLESAIDGILSHLTNRHPVLVHYLKTGEIIWNSNLTRSHSPELSVTYSPKIRLRIAGRGADCLSLAHLGQLSNFDIRLQMTDSDDVHQAESSGLSVAAFLTTPESLPTTDDDCWTAFILAFHDEAWEAPLLEQALAGPAFYIGAVGSRRTHDKRCAALAKRQVSQERIESIHAPIGLVHSLRDASKLAISTLAEITQAESQTMFPDLSETAIVLLAAGNSSRFETGDKLLTKLGKKPLLTYAAELAHKLPVARRLAVTQQGQKERQQILVNAGWQIIENPDAQSGQASSLRSAILELMDDNRISRVVICLADMPNVSARHIINLCQMVGEDHKAVYSATERTIMPPAVFSRELFNDLIQLTGDQGARQLPDMPLPPGILPISAEGALDIDTVEDLQALNASPGPLVS